MKNNKITVITNPISGGKQNKRALAESIVARAAKNGFSGIIRFTEGRGDATNFATEAATEGHHMVVVLGGDGTVNEAATGLVNTGVALGIIPLGSGNGLARTLGLPLQPEQAREMLFTGAIRNMDAGIVNGRYFFLVAGVGFDAVVGKSFDEFHRRGPLAYFYLGAREFFAYRPDKLRIQIDNDHQIETTAFTVAIANGRQYGNNALIAPHAILNDGRLNLVIIHRFTLWHVLTQLHRVFAGKIKTFKEAEFHEVASVRIERKGPGPVNIDGEPYELEQMLHISSVPAALKVVVPPNATCFS